MSRTRTIEMEECPPQFIFSEVRKKPKWFRVFLQDGFPHCWHRCVSLVALLSVALDACCRETIAKNHSPEIQPFRWIWVKTGKKPPEQLGIMMENSARRKTDENVKRPNLLEKLQPMPFVVDFKDSQKTAHFHDALCENGVAN